MRLTIFGGTGATGRILVNDALAAGHHVTAYARTPSKLPIHPRLDVIEGTLDDAPAIDRAVDRADAVLSMLGPSTDPAGSAALVTGYQHILAGMNAHAVRRLILMGTPSIADPADRRDLRVAALVAGIRLMQRHAYDAIVQIGNLVRSSDLDWTIVRFPLLSNGPASAAINARHVGQNGGLRLSRRNAATYFLRQLDATDQHRNAPLISDH